MINTTNRHELTMEGRNKVRTNIERLEYFEGQGLLKGAKKKLLANEVYLSDTRLSAQLRSVSKEL